MSYACIASDVQRDLIAAPAGEHHADELDLTLHLTAKAEELQVLAERKGRRATLKWLLITSMNDSESAKNSCGA